MTPKPLADGFTAWNRQQTEIFSVKTVTFSGFTVLPADV